MNNNDLNKANKAHLKQMIGMGCSIIASSFCIFKIFDGRIEFCDNFYFVNTDTSATVLNFEYTYYEDENYHDLYTVKISHSEKLNHPFQVFFSVRKIERIHVYTYTNYKAGEKPLANIFQFDFNTNESILVYPNQFPNTVLGVEFEKIKIELFKTQNELQLIETIL